MASIITLTHAAIGWFAAGVANAGLNVVVQFFRNGSYMQLDQSFDGFARMTGISPEPSLYASFGFAWFVFTTELWLRNVDRRWSGPAALVMFLTLLVSTSSTAYVGLLGYSTIVLLRLVFFVGTIPARKGFAMATCLLVLVMCGLALIAGSEEVTNSVARILRLTTSDKLNSESGIACNFWAMQGFHAFATSWGLGIGIGSFRSSSILTAVLGSSGAIGVVALVLYLLRVFRPFARATYTAVGDIDRDTATAAAWTVMMVLVPASVSSPTPDPGLLWRLLAGTLLALRSVAARQIAAAPWSEPQEFSPLPSQLVAIDRSTIVT